MLGSISDARGDMSGVASPESSSVTYEDVGARVSGRAKVQLMPLFSHKEHCTPPLHLVLFAWQASQARILVI
jgi:hypothetical protein